MSATWRQTVSDELMRLIDAQRGVLSVQEFTALALAHAVRRHSCAAIATACASAASATTRIASHSGTNVRLVSISQADLGWAARTLFQVAWPLRRWLDASTQQNPDVGKSDAERV